MSLSPEVQKMFDGYKQAVGLCQSERDAKILPQLTRVRDALEMQLYQYIKTTKSVELPEIDVLCSQSQGTGLGDQILNDTSIFSTPLIASMRVKKFITAATEYQRELNQESINPLKVSELEKGFPRIIKAAVVAGMNAQDKQGRAFYDAALKHRPEFIKELVKEGVTGIGDLSTIGNAKKSGIIPMPLMASMQINSLDENKSEFARGEGELIKKGMNEGVIKALGRATVVTVAQDRPEVDYTQFMHLDPKRKKDMEDVYANLKALKTEADSLVKDISSAGKLDMKKLEDLERRIRENARDVIEKLNPANQIKSIAAEVHIDDSRRGSSSSVDSNHTASVRSSRSNSPGGLG